MKRLLDIVLSFLGFLLSSPIVLPTILAIWLQDFKSPFYIAPRVGKDEKVFNMVKLRSMVVGADTTGVDTTSAQDSRITKVGHFVRAYKLDELSQLWNVLIGDMSLVGPRPNVKRETDLYTTEEKNLLSIKPGITDISSIVFSDESIFLKDSKDPDIDYNQLIRPWKSRLGLFYIENQSFLLDIKLIWFTGMAILSREMALAGINKILVDLCADEQLIQVAKREYELKPYPPPGSDEIVTHR